MAQTSRARHSLRDASHPTPPFADKAKQDKVQASERISGKRSKHRSVARSLKTRSKSPTQHAQHNHITLRRITLPKSRALDNRPTSRLSRPNKASCHTLWTSYACKPVVATKTLESRSHHLLRSRYSRRYVIQDSPTTNPLRYADLDAFHSPHRHIVPYHKSSLCRDIQSLKHSLQDNSTIFGVNQVAAIMYSR